MRRTTRAVASRFSVPLSIAMRAPLETGTHSTRHAQRLGQVDRRDDAVALGRRQRAHAARRVREHEHALHALGHLLGRACVITPNTIALVLRPYGRPPTLIARGGSASDVEVVLLELAGRERPPRLERRSAPSCR